jgi:hypothetical protein
VSELEAIIDAQLAQPAIAASIAAGIVDANAFLAQEFLVAESLDTVLRERGTLAPEEVHRLAGQVAGALDDAADCGIEHGGLHPRDILLAGDQVKLTGLGIVRALERVGVSAPVRRPYTSPERVAGATWDRRADVFSLAALVCELLWGRRIAGMGTAAVEALGEVTGKDAAVVGLLRPVLAKALDEQPEARFESATAFVDAMGKAFKGESSELPAPSQSPAPSPQPPVRRHARRPTPRVIATAERRPPVEIQAEGPLPLAETPSLVAEVPLRRSEPVPEPTLPTLDAAVQGPAPQQSNWPLAASLAVGLAVGFASGYGVGMHGRTTATVQAPTAATETVAASVAAPPVEHAASTERPAPPPLLETPLQAATPNLAAPHAVPAPPKAPVKPSASAAVGILQVRSVPAGATVILDGEEHGRTPITLRELSNGPHRVRVSRDGYTVEERRITITTSKPSSTLDVRLVRDRAAAVPARGRTSPPVAAESKNRSTATGSSTTTAPAASLPSAALTVRSKPAGASVFVDGRLVGTTPLMISGLTVGDRAVRIESQGYRAWSSSVELKAGMDNKVTASLER